jgi:2-polyprenyl-6-methoxyphenol hydroxylase-like FAD-dependent oxidoreductase
MSQTSAQQVRVAIAVGGPAGMMLGYLLARGGIEVAVLEKYPDFFRDFRGDTIHPSTMNVLHELGILGEFLKLKHNEVRELGASIGDRPSEIADCDQVKLLTVKVGRLKLWHRRGLVCIGVRAEHVRHSVRPS